MNGLLRLLHLLAMAIWVGGLIFFAFVLAPTAFHTLPSIHEAGLIVGATLRVFDLIGMVCGLIFLLATAAILRQTAPPVRTRYEWQCLLAALMLLSTAYIHWGILPAMDEDQRLTGGDIALVAPDNPARVGFDKLHMRSERVEGAVLLAGLGVLFLMSRGQLVEHRQRATEESR